ncbi:hypothetical protein VNI00_013511 [Paramarasmius palmivorus]|uniref:Uncharacterized protein n=1 Tax=Paramarasmius palmivorus TaxID=297713 RepID=A0AAW0BY94_9AGAR
MAPSEPNEDNTKCLQELEAELVKVETDLAFIRELRSDLDKHISVGVEIEARYEEIRRQCESLVRTVPLLRGWVD